jgi:hypothetical protein
MWLGSDHPLFFLQPYLLHCISHFHFHPRFPQRKGQKMAVFSYCFAT